ncbi:MULTISPECIES: hypothetical protein [Micromonospora]|uniref:Membrane domain of glycerophosphoryl diester phosphodiesterase n=1 Tax=Micromonospora yangpuensis TaxID=683228 RepID=A0A1C6VD08_9ACTN|nr:hypothetical protein [Micromonospora yangpuensis]SCL64243.1 hypothetical protein GA0070617_5423 [Micromonospora yangpuensis]
MLLPLTLLTQVLPTLIISVVTLLLDPTFGIEEPAPGALPVLPDGFTRDMVVFGITLLAATVLVGLVQSIGWAAGSWVIARQAAGEPVDFATALRYGLRRALGLWGWTLVLGLLILVGVCFCILPGIYLAAALSLAGPVYLFERSNPIGRSFRMFHDRFGMMLGRVALLGAVVFGIAVLLDLLESVGMLPFGDDPMTSPQLTVGAIVVVSLSALLSLPAHLIQLVGLVVTYAEQRIHEAPVNSARLAAELG